ncbi:MAG: hypothetical protein K940chlam7_00890 [Chlamydiae bacterium]|nr:hypothetical protein [Chlamydiota bacterium]
MIIPRILTTLFSVLPYQPKEVASVQQPEVKLDVPIETLSKAILDKQSNGTLRLMIDRLEIPECRIFNSEKSLDLYLSTNQNIDIWEIQDKREAFPRTIYKYHTWDKIYTYINKEELYREISSGTEHGVFCINNLENKENTYIQKKRGWFAYGFEEISREQAMQTIIEKEASKDTWRKGYAIGMVALAAAPTVYGMRNSLAKGWKNWTHPEQTFSNSFLNVRMPNPMEAKSR